MLYLYYKLYLNLHRNLFNLSLPAFSPLQGWFSSKSCFWSCCCFPFFFIVLSVGNNKQVVLFCWLFLFCERELAIQIAEQFEALGSGIGLRCGVVSFHFPYYLNWCSCRCLHIVHSTLMVNFICVLFFFSAVSLLLIACRRCGYSATDSYPCQKTTYCCKYLFLLLFVSKIQIAPL